MTIFNIQQGDHVKICHINNSTNHSIGEIHKILSNTPEEKIVILRDGTKGIVTDVIQSKELIKKRIMCEDQHTENKASFYGTNMSTASIPQAVQSFLNSDGGYLYIGVSDSGTLQKRLTGLVSDFKTLQEKKDNKNLEIDELCDALTRNILASLNKYLTSVIPIAELLTFDFIDIQNVKILEIRIKKSPEPWFYKYLSGTNKPRPFVTKIVYKVEEQIVEQQIERYVEDFYIRNVNSKKLINTNSEVYNYIRTHFKN